MLEKNDQIEQAIPFEWRAILIEIIDIIRNRDLRSKEISGHFCNVESEDVDTIYRNIDSYGDNLIALPDGAWDTSVCRWMGGYWHSLTDLFTEDEGASDLVLFVDVYETDALPRFEIKSVHVP
jgi:hypothetical protein